MIDEEAIGLVAEDNVRLALWKVHDSACAAPERHVFLTHGTFSDRRVCLGIARYLAGLGFTCWILEWRGHGNSQREVPTFDFETVALRDVRAALTHLIEGRRIRSLDCITHSGGGIVLTMCLARHPHLRPAIGNVVLFACQASHAGFSLARQALLRAMKACSRIAGRVPGKALRIGIQDESYLLMKQWYDWNIARRFNGHDGFDYLLHMERLALPALAVFGEGDRFIAPAQSCRRYLAAFNHPDSRELHGAVSNGFSQDFGHASVLHSTAARNEIWPLARAWLDRETSEDASSFVRRRCSSPALSGL